MAWDRSADSVLLAVRGDRGESRPSDPDVPIARTGARIHSERFDMTSDDLRALLDAAAKATPGPWHQAGIANNDRHWMRETRDGNNRSVAWCGTNPEQEAHRNAAYIAAASPDVVAALARIALAAAEVSLYKTARSHAATQGSEAFIDACLKLRLAENAMNDALRDAGLLTTAPQETK